MDQEELRTLSQKIAVELSTSPNTFTAIEGSHEDFLEIGAYFLEHYGGSLSILFLLKNYKHVMHFGIVDFRRLIAKMEFNPNLGIDVLLQFYGQFTRVPLDEFSFFSEFGYSPHELHLSSHFEEKSIDLELAGWTFLSKEESARRIFDQVGLPYSVMTELQALDRLPHESTISN